MNEPKEEHQTLGISPLDPNAKVWDMGPSIPLKEIAERRYGQNTNPLFDPQEFELLRLEKEAFCDCVPAGKISLLKQLERLKTQEKLPLWAVPKTVTCRTCGKVAWIGSLPGKAGEIVSEHQQVPEFYSQQSHPDFPGRDEAFEEIAREEMESKDALLEKLQKDSDRYRFLRSIASFELGSYNGPDYIRNATEAKWYIHTASAFKGNPYLGPKHPHLSEEEFNKVIDEAILLKRQEMGLETAYEQKLDEYVAENYPAPNPEPNPYVEQLKEEVAKLPDPQERIYPDDIPPGEYPGDGWGDGEIGCSD
jgi:hypothetical protein